MADGLSVAASVIAVVQLAGSCLELSRKWLGPSEFSSADLAAVKTTLLGFKEAIIKFHEHLTMTHGGDRQESLEYLPHVLKRCKEALDMVQSFMENSGLIRKHVIGPRFDRKLKASLKALEAAKELFAFALHADNQAILLKIQQYVQRFAEDSLRFQKTTTDSLKRLDENIEEIIRGVKSLGDTDMKRLDENIEEIVRGVKSLRVTDLKGLHEKSEEIAMGVKVLGETDMKRLQEKSEEIARGVKSLGDTDPKKLHENSEAILREVRGVREDLSKITSTKQKQLHKQTPITGLVVSKRKRRQLLLSLHFDQIDARKMAIEDAHASTCTWFPGTSKFRDWLDGNKLNNHHGFLWIKGNPGTGKSTLMKFILANSKTWMKDTLIICFFFNARGSDLEKSTVGMYRSLLFQLLQRHRKSRDILDPVARSASDVERYQWSLELMKSLFEQAVRSLEDSSLTCLVDALDECNEHEIRNMISFFEHLGELTTSMSIQFRICLSSRHYPHITIAKGIDLILERQEGHTQDIANYTESELKIGHSKLANQVRMELQEKARGIFMWVVLAVGILNREHDHGNIHELPARLRDIPGDLHALFRNILTRDYNNKGRLLLCIQWVLFASCPLTPEELYFALVCDTDPKMICVWDPEEITPTVMSRFILSSSKGLVEVTGSDNQRVQFIHESVKDFLLTADGLKEIWPGLEGNLYGNSHERLKQCCFVHVTLSRQRAIGPHVRLTRFPFLHYATANVLYHADAAAAGGVNQESFLSSFPVAQWCALAKLFRLVVFTNYTQSVSLLYILAQFNLPALIRVHPSKQSCLDVEDSLYGTPIFAAVACGREEAATALLEVEAAAQPENIRFQSLSKQCFRPKVKSNIIEKSVPKFSRTDGVLNHAVKNFDDKLVDFILSSSKFDVNHTSEDGQTPLQYAFAMRDAAMVEVLLANGADFGGEYQQGYKPVQWASAMGHENILKLLLENGASVKAPGDEITPLRLATEAGHANIVKLLLENGADLEARDEYGYTPLQLATERGNVSIVKLLLEHGANAEVQYQDDFTPLRLATGRNYTDIVKLLLGRGAATEARDTYGETPLLVAARGANKVIVKALLDKGADIEARDRAGRTPLSWALEKGYINIAKMLQHAAVR